jgi:hypothetical protein
MRRIVLEEAAIAEAKAKAQTALFQILDAAGSQFGMGTSAGDEMRSTMLRSSATLDAAKPQLSGMPRGN